MECGELGEINIMNHSTSRDLFLFDIQKKSKELTKSEDHTVWNSLFALEKAANTLHPDFKNLWKWVKSKHPFNAVDSGQTETILRMDLTNTLYILVNNMTEELEELKNGLKNNSTYMIKSFQ